MELASTVPNSKANSTKGAAMAFIVSFVAAPTAIAVTILTTIEA